MGFVYIILVGVIIGTISALPMYMKKMPKNKCISAFIQYMVTTFIIFNTNLPFINQPWWLQGPFLSFTMALPIVLLIYKEEKKSVPIVLANSILLGLIVSVIKYFTQDIANCIYQITPWLWE